MPSNVELKARLADRCRLVQVVRTMAHAHSALRQQDTYFGAARGRLKLRLQELLADNGEAQLEVFVSVGEALKGYLGWNQHAASAQIVEGNVRGWQFVFVSLRGGFVRFEGADEDEGAVGAIAVNGESARRKAQHETARNSVDAEGRET
ncbi:hypothetical protein HPB52_004504 [Rhipicephalus sanguineus]|uniref:Uncharacterized protein n=1 Tax=Rhipicephalus sanguineus TaxID=34632 RepID=A0A9D4T2L6_RHISA|nr:hypothetical protein HPB52_004504 [Rhipicephalus sanguineus]